MKKLILAAAAVLAFTGVANAQAVRIGTEGAYAPWNFINASGELAGLDIDVANEVCKRAGFECTFVQTAWDTIIPNLNAGNFDAIMAGMSVTDERKQSIDFSDEYSPPESSSFLVLPGTDLDFDNLQGVRIGTQSSTIQAGYVDENLKEGNTVLNFDTAEQALADLSAGNIDVILADTSYLDELVAGSGGAMEIAGPKVVIGGGVAAGLRKDDDDLEQKFNAALAEAKADGTIDALITKWFPEREGPFFTE